VLPAVTAGTDDSSGTTSGPMQTIELLLMNLIGLATSNSSRASGISPAHGPSIRFFKQSIHQLPPEESDRPAQTKK
jgi:hypothetical protein